MTQKISTLLLSLTLLVTACHSSTSHGECIGLTDEGNPNLRYEIDAWNAVWSILGFEMFFVPVVLWFTDYAMCPVGHRATPAPVKVKVNSDAQAEFNTVHKNVVEASENTKKNLQ